MNRVAWLRVCLAAWLVGCAGPAGTRDGSPPPPAETSIATAAVPAALQGFCQRASRDGERPLAGYEPVERSGVATASESGIEAPLRCAIRTSAQWEAFRAASRQMVLPDSAADFGREMLLVATQGMRSTTGYAIAFGPVLARLDTVAAVVVATSSETGVQGDVITTPIAVVRVAARPGPVLWMERERR